MRANKVRCSSCQRDFCFSEGRYDGHHIGYYDLDVCSGCYRANWDGWGPSMERKLLRHLEERGIAAPQRNDKGWLPLDPEKSSTVVLG